MSSFGYFVNMTIMAGCLLNRPFFLAAIQGLLSAALDRNIEGGLNHVAVADCFGVVVIDFERGP
jgi:hypothetical protein